MKQIFEKTRRNHASQISSSTARNYDESDDEEAYNNRKTKKNSDDDDVDFGNEDDMGIAATAKPTRGKGSRGGPGSRGGRGSRGRGSRGGRGASSTATMVKQSQLPLTNSRQANFSTTKKITYDDSDNDIIEENDGFVYKSSTKSSSNKTVNNDLSKLKQTQFNVIKTTPSVRRKRIEFDDDDDDVNIIDDNDTNDSDLFKKKSKTSKNHNDDENDDIPNTFSIFKKVANSNRKKL